MDMERLAEMDAELKRRSEAMGWERPEDSITAAELMAETGLRTTAAGQKLLGLFRGGLMARRKLNGMGGEMVYYPIALDDGNGEVYGE